MVHQSKHCGRSSAGIHMINDIGSQAWQRTQAQPSSPLLTMLGMAWGIATVVLLLAYGAGLSAA